MASLDHVTWYRRRPLRDPLLIAAFEGWNDAGDAATTATRHLRSPHSVSTPYSHEPISDSRPPEFGGGQYMQGGPSACMPFTCYIASEADPSTQRAVPSSQRALLMFALLRFDESFDLVWKSQSDCP